MKPCESLQSLLDAGADTDPAVVLSATLYLMSCYACSGCPRLANIVMRHLQAIARLDSTAEPLRATCRQLCLRWEALAQPHDPATQHWYARLAGTTPH